MGGDQENMNKSKGKTVGNARVPDGMLLYAVGDIHGQLHLLDALLEQMLVDSGTVQAPRRVLVFMGDYIDRGPDSAGVIKRLASGLPVGFEVYCLMGNHEDILLKFLDDPQTLGHWLRNGAETTLASYGIETPGSDASAADHTRCRDRFAAALPSAHLAFLKRLLLHVSFGDYLFAHAGIRPGVALADQGRRDFLWIREGFLDSDADFGAVIVHGHTLGSEPVVRPNRIGIDTGAFVNGCLTALRLFREERDFLSAAE